MRTATLMLLISALFGGYVGVQGLGDGTGAGRAERVTAETASLAQWQAEFQSRRNRHYSQAEHRSLLSTVRALRSQVGEELAVPTDRAAATLLLPDHPRDPAARLDAQLLSLWLNVASGSLALDDPADANGDATGETTVGALVQESVEERESSTPRRAALLGYAHLIEQVNERD